MAIALKLRGKILCALLLLAVVPLFVSLYFISNFTKDQIRGSMAEYAEKASNFIERSNAATAREITNYLTLFSTTSDLINATYYASLTDDSDQISDYLTMLRTQYDIDIIEVRKPKGELLIRAANDELAIDLTKSDQHPLLLQVIETGEIRTKLSSYLGHLTILVATPIKLQNQIVGYLLGAQILDDAFAANIRSASGVEVAFLAKGGVVGASHPTLKDPAFLVDLDTDGSSFMLDETSYLPLIKPLLGDDYRLLMALDLSNELEALQSLRGLMSILIVIVIGIVLFSALLFSKKLTRPLSAVVGNLKEIAHGEGDLTQTLEVPSNDEIGELASSFNSFTEGMRGVAMSIRETAVEVNSATEKIRLTSRDVNTGTNQQADALEESFQAIQAIDEAATAVADSISSLLEAVEISSSATLELGATIEEIVGQVERLFSTVEGITSSTTEMSASSQQVADNLENLTSSTEVTASSITEMDASIKEVEETARQTMEISEQARQDAEQGKQAVANTIAGIQSIRVSVGQASQVITELGKQSGEIGSILTVIDEVADQTRLLSLNASIIAAQAGEHGKGFAVVADEIRELAERTAMSTQEIAAIIKRLQAGTKEAVATMQQSSERVVEEAERSKVAEEALAKLTASSLQSAEQVRTIVRATEEQARGSRQITVAVNQVANMLQQISSAVKQQSTGIHQLAEATEAMKDIASQVKLSTGEQARGSHQINENMEHIRTTLDQINKASSAQSEQSQQVVAAVAAVRAVAESNAARTVELDRVVETLADQAQRLDQKIGSLKT